MKGDREYYYNKGVIEGYFDVRLENILDQDIDIRKSFIEGYKAGKIKKRRLTEEQLKKYDMNRLGYIKQIGYEVGYNDYPASSTSLGEREKEVFELGLNAGLAKKTLDEKKNAKVRKIK